MPTVRNSGLKKKAILPQTHALNSYTEVEFEAIEKGKYLPFQRGPHCCDTSATYWPHGGIGYSCRVLELFPRARPPEQLILNQNWVYQEWLLPQLYSREISFLKKNKKKKTNHPISLNYYIIVLQGSWNIQILKWFAREKHLTLKVSIFTHPEKINKNKKYVYSKHYLSSGQNFFFFLTHQGLRFKNTFSKNYNINLKLLESS